MRCAIDPCSHLDLPRVHGSTPRQRKIQKMTVYCGAQGCSYVQRVDKAQGMQLVFAKFDSIHSMWASNAQTMAMLDVLGALAETAGRAGYC
eukprot:14180165-Ditylum_brightwellii.AAC.1